MTEHIIFDSTDTYSEENKKLALENILENIFWDGSETAEVVDNFGKKVTLTRTEYQSSVTEEKIMKECSNREQINFEDASWVLQNSVTPHIRNGIIAFNDVRFWCGRKIRYKEYKDVQSVLYSSCDYVKVFVDGYKNLRKYEYDHDGTNTILYRAWRNKVTEQQKENFYAKCYDCKLTQADVSRYTQNIGSLVAAIYGW